MASYLWSKLSGHSSSDTIKSRLSLSKGQDVELLQVDMDDREINNTSAHIDLSGSRVSDVVSTFVRLAGFSGALAVCMGAYGFHVFRHKTVDEELKIEYEIANKYHFFHSLALLACPMTKQPILTGILLIIGMLLFCVSGYYHALTGNMPIIELTPYGGSVLILAWISMAF